MAEIISMPKMSDTMTEGIVVKWHKKVGDSVKVGELMAEIETDKSTMDYESYHEGTILYLGVGEGKSIRVDDILAIVGEKGENFSSLLQNNKPQTEKNKLTTVSTEYEESKENSAMDISTVKANIVTMPKMSDTMEEGVIVAWHKKVGDSIKVGELMAEIETDKATMEYESYHAGVLLYRGVEEKKTIAVNDVLAIVGEKKADWNALLQHHKSVAISEKITSSEPFENTESSPSEMIHSRTSKEHPMRETERIKASPLAKKMAHEKGYNIADIHGSGDHGRIVKRDIEEFIPSQVTPLKSKHFSQQLPRFYGEESYEDVPLSTMRKTIARRLVESKFSAPHFYLTMEINMDRAIEARKNINEIAPVKISFNDMIIRATAASLRQHPNVNVSWRDETIRKNRHIHIGVAVAVKDGLVVPVIRFADNKSLSHLATEMKEVAQKAQQKKLQPTDYEGNTFTISNLGMFGISEFTAIVNPPDACILAVGVIQEVPIVKNHELVSGHMMKVTLSCDHRAVDGAIGSAFLLTLKKMLEEPVCILI